METPGKVVRGTISRSLEILTPNAPHTFIAPIKKINEGQDVSAFLTSRAYRDIGIFINQLNRAMCPRKTENNRSISFYLDSPITYSAPIQQLQELLQKISAIIEEAPPDTGPRRFGNVSFRKWYQILEGRIEELLKTYLPQKVQDFPSSSEHSSILQELTAYFMGGFGSAQRLDYGTGHELSFIAFLGCLWKLGTFSQVITVDGSLEREIVIGVIEPYLELVRKLIHTYTLEPAGSHGVWGLDDHSFVSYIFGSAQYSPAISEKDAMPTEGTLRGSPKPGGVVKKDIVDEERQHNMYFSAIGFINDVKTGPFWEHSPMLFDISGVPQGWAKINKGMLKMYNAEVLSKFPVVQHFPFGSLFSWEQDLEASFQSTTIHTSSQPVRADVTARPQAQETTKAPWSISSANAQVSTQAPWAVKKDASSHAITSAPWAQASQRPSQAAPMTRAPWAAQSRDVEKTTSLPSRVPDGPTRAPWAKKE